MTAYRLLTATRRLTIVRARSVVNRSRHVSQTFERLPLGTSRSCRVLQTQCSLESRELRFETVYISGAGIANMHLGRRWSRSRKWSSASSAANAALGAWLKAMNDVLGALKREGSLNSVRDRLASFEDRQRVLQKEKYDRFETLNTNGSTAADK